MKTEVKVKKARLYEQNGEWFINVTYTYEDDRYVKEINIPKLHIPLEQFEGHVNQEYRSTPWGRRTICEISARFGNLYVPLGVVDSDTVEGGYVYTEKIIDEKTQEMTLDEIEKKLGYKIKIVNKK